MSLIESTFKTSLNLLLEVKINSLGSKIILFPTEKGRKTLRDWTKNKFTLQEEGMEIENFSKSHDFLRILI